MTIDRSIVGTGPYKYGLAVAESIPTGVKLLRQEPMCKAYLWDCVNHHFQTAADLKECIVVYTKNPNSVLDWTPEEIQAIQDRLTPLEKAFHFKKTIITHVPESKAIVFHASVRWMAHVNLYSLLLSAIRYSNTYDKMGYDESIEKLPQLVEWYNTTCKNKSLKIGWPAGIGTHGLGICHYWASLPK